MRAEIIGVGTEILLGQIANENARWMSERLAEVGIDVWHHQAVGDNVDRIRDAFRQAMSRADLVISTGGLGPTQDDVTREGLAAALGVELVRHPEIEETIRRRFAASGRRMPASNLRQADVPAGGRAIDGEGTAPGIVCRTPEGGRVYCLPGVPHEMREMMGHAILPELASLAGAAIVSRVVVITGMSESRVAEMLDDLFQDSTNPTIAFLASAGEVKVRVTAKAATRAEAEALIEPVVGEVGARFGPRVVDRAGETLDAVVARLLADGTATVACAESLTGGGLAARLTARPGASAYFVGSAVCYTKEAKRRVLGVPADVLAEGTVSERCALEMARGARRLFGSDVALALTGAAGPEPHDGKTPGTVCVAIVAEGVKAARMLKAPGDREHVRLWAEKAALELLRRHLAGLPMPESLGPSTRVS